jgi:hypothetical protein
MPRAKIDRDGNLWVCLGKALPRPTYGPEFGHEVKEPTPADLQACPYSFSIGPAIDEVIQLASDRSSHAQATRDHR